MKTEHKRPLEERSLRLHVAIFGYFVFATILAIISWQGLVADGVGYFVSVLVRSWPTTFDWSRIFGHALVQWPLVLAVRAGVTNTDILLYTHSFGLYYLGPLQLLFCYLVVPREQRTELVWPLISLFAGSMNAWFVAMTEAHVMTFIFWPLVMFMLHGRVDQRIRLIVFLILVGATLLSYQTMAVQGIVLTAFALWRSRQVSRTGERNLWRAVAVWFFLGVSLAIYSILNPFSTENLHSFMSGMFRFAGTQISDLNYPVILSIITLGLIAFLFFGRTLSPKIFHRLILFLGVAAVWTAFAPVLIPDSLRPIQQFQARAWIGFLPVALAMAMIGVRMQNPRISPVVFERALILVSILALSQTTWQMLATAQWRGYIKLLRSELSQYKGFISYDRSPLLRQSDGIQVIRNLGWSWTYPSMSIVLAPGGRVSTIFGAKPGVWQPFDPQHPQELPELAKYGIDYSAYVRALASP